MVVCSTCNGESAPSTAFCVHCGAKLPVTGAHATQFGMPLQRPQTASERGAGPATTQFGPDELAALSLAAQDAGLDEPAPQKTSLMAGLPRPPVSSAPSPLTASAGPKSPSTPRPAPPFAPKVSPAATSTGIPASRRTVMGMPLMGAGSAPPGPLPPPSNAPVAAPPPAAESTGTGEAMAGASAILSMDSLVNDLLNPSPVAALTATGRETPKAKASEVSPALGTNPTPVEPPAVRISRAQLPSQDTEPVTHKPPAGEVPTETDGSAWVAGLIVVAVAAAIGFYFFGR